MFEMESQGAVRGQSVSPLAFWRADSCADSCVCLTSVRQTHLANKTRFLYTGKQKKK